MCVNLFICIYLSTKSNSIKNKKYIIKSVFLLRIIQDWENTNKRHLIYNYISIFCENVTRWHLTGYKFSIQY